MCLAVPMKIEAVLDDRTGVGNLDGSRHDVDLSLIDDPKPGEFIIVHAGYAIEKLDEREANARLKLFEALAESHAEEQPHEVH
jgi:hydrogenase expression/formation protein HypC